MDTATLEKPDTAKAEGAASIQAKTTQAKSRPDSIFLLAKKHLEEADGDIDKATDAMVALLINDKALLRGLLFKIVSNTVRDRVRLAQRIKRQQISIHATRNIKLAVEDFSKAMAVSLLDFPLMNGVKLRDATKADLLASVEHYELQAGESQRRADFLNAVLKITPVNGVAGDVLDDEQAQKLWNESANEL